MKDKLKLWLRRWTLRTLRKLLDLADDRLHAAEVKLREELSNLPGTHKKPEQHLLVSSRKNQDMLHRKTETVSKESSELLSVPGRLLKPPRRRGVTASAFDLRFSSSREV